MSFKYELNTLLNKEMDRKTFLKHIAFAILMLTGASMFIKLVSTMNKGNLSLTNSVASSRAGGPKGYGAPGAGYGARLESES